MENQRCILLQAKINHRLVPKMLKNFKLYVQPSEVVLITYASSNHFHESRKGIISLRAAFQNKIIFYDLGLSNKEVIYWLCKITITVVQVEELSHVCNLEVRKFNFGKFPTFVGQLFQYHFKAIITAVSKKSSWITTILQFKYRKYTASSRAFGYWMPRFDSPPILRSYWNSIQMYGILQADLLAQLAWKYSDFVGKNWASRFEASCWSLYLCSDPSRSGYLPLIWVRQ